MLQIKNKEINNHKNVKIKMIVQNVKNVILIKKEDHLVKKKIINPFKKMKRVKTLLLIKIQIGEKKIQVTNQNSLINTKIKNIIIIIIIVIIVMIIIIITTIIIVITIIDHEEVEVILEVVVVIIVINIVVVIIMNIENLKILNKNLMKVIRIKKKKRKKQLKEKNYIFYQEQLMKIRQMKWLNPNQKFLVKEKLGNQKKN